MSRRVNKNFRPKPGWSDFEDEVYGQVLQMVRDHGLMVEPSSVKVLRNAEYFSKKRNRNINFEIAIEGFAGESKTRSLLWIWECKNYPTKNVKVDEVEEFADKLDQVGAHKGTIVTRKGFATGAVERARADGIGLAVLGEGELMEVTHFAAAGGSHWEFSIPVRWALCYRHGDHSPVIVKDRDDFKYFIHAELLGAGLLRT